MAKSAEKPKIINAEIVAKSRFFQVEALDLCFSNGEQRRYERMKSNGRGAVMVVPIHNNENLILVREYAAGTHSYELSFPKSLIDEGEQALAAANRELMEEAGFGAKQFYPLKSLQLAPAYFANAMSVYIADNLYPQVLEGDEPEPLEVVYWPLKDAMQLLNEPDFNEARSICALLLALKWLETDPRPGL